MAYPSSNIHFEPNFYFHQYQNIIAATPRLPQQPPSNYLSSPTPIHSQQFHAQYFSVTNANLPMDNSSNGNFYLGFWYLYNSQI